MSKDNPGFFRRLVTWTGKIVSGLRWVINLLFLVIVISVLISLFSDDVRPLPEKAPLRLVVSGSLVEERSYTDPLTQLMEQSSPYDAETPIRDLIDAIKEARDDKRITGLILDLYHFKSGGIAKLSEIGAAIRDFKNSGKPVIAYSDDFSQQQYFLASYADEIIVNPMGGVIFTGFGYYGSFFKEATDKLKINVHVFKAGRYKSAVEPFTRNEMSEESRENTRQWVEPLWQQFTRTIEENRKLPAGTIDNLANNLPQMLEESRGDLASLALRTRLVDKVLPRTQLGDMLVGRFGKSETSYLSIHHKEYLRHIHLPLMDKPPTGNNNIGFIVASGTILDGEQMEGSIGGDSFSKLLQKARQDSSLKALVIRVDSPGGSAFASDIIRQEIKRTQQSIPVVISMGAMAASGGYWISAGADEIWAQPSTLTGSIGVFGILPTFEDSLGALGVHNDGVGTNNLSDFYALDRSLSEEAGKVLQLSIDNIYLKFLQLVAGGRGTTVEKIEPIAEGRVWTGQQAREIGLVDNLGNLDDAIAAAAGRAGLDRWTVKPITRQLSFQEQILKQMAEGAVSVGIKLFGYADAERNPLTGLSLLLKGYLEKVSQLNDPQGIYLQCFGCPET